MDNMITSDESNFKGILGGYSVRFNNLKSEYHIKLKDGIRGFNIPCVVNFNRETNEWKVILNNRELEIVEVSKIIWKKN